IGALSPLSRGAEVAESACATPPPLRCASQGRGREIERVPPTDPFPRFLLDTAHECSEMGMLNKRAQESRSSLANSPDGQVASWPVSICQPVRKFLSGT